MKTLILAALKDELDANEIQDLKVCYTGVGKVNAAIKTLQAIQKYSPDLIINFGTAGSLNTQLKGLIEVCSFYQRDMDVMQTIENFIENQNTFPERSTFSFLKLLDLKEGLVNHISNSILDSQIQKENIVNPNTKSVFTAYNEKFKSKYVNRIKSLDLRLGLLYSYLNSLKDKKISIILCSDHGQSFLNDDPFLLSSKRTRVPFLYKSNIHNSKKLVYEYTENIDIFATILNDSDIKSNQKNNDSRLPEILGGRNKRTFSFSQSIYPNQTYKAAFRSEGNELFLETIKKTNKSGFCSIIGKNEYKLMLNGETYDGDLPSDYKKLLKTLFAK